MNTFKETEAEIRRLVPRLMELSFGCEIYLKEVFNRDERSKYAKVLKKWYSDKGGHRVSYEVPSGTCGWGHQSIDSIQIIGHPITLEDVLEAIDIYIKNKYINHTLDDMFLDFEDFGMKIKRGGRFPKYEWNFTFNGFSQSSIIKPKDVIIIVLLSGFAIRLKNLWQYGKPYGQQPKKVHNFVAKILFNKLNK